MLTCKQAAALMSQAQDRRLGARERLGLHLHLLVCTACTNYRRQLATLRRACRRYAGLDDSNGKGS